MEIIHGFSAFEKPVFSEHICNGKLPIAVTDTIFIYKFAKKGESVSSTLPLIT